MFGRLRELLTTFPGRLPVDPTPPVPRVVAMADVPPSGVVAVEGTIVAVAGTRSLRSCAGRDVAWRDLVVEEIDDSGEDSEPIRLSVFAFVDAVAFDVVDAHGFAVRVVPLPGRLAMPAASLRLQRADADTREAILDLLVAENRAIDTRHGLLFAEVTLAGSQPVIVEGNVHWEEVDGVIRPVVSSRGEMLTVWESAS
jgi:hypothetical protein